MIEIKGMEQLQAKLKRFKQELGAYVTSASVEESESLLDNTVGLRKYPPETAANKLPTPYYIRGMGTQYKSRNNMKSEQLGTKWVVKKAPFGARVMNTASYSQYVHGKKQASALANIGWRRIDDVFPGAKDKIVKRIDVWIKKLLNKLGL